MSEKRPGFTFERHVEIGKLLYRMHKDLAHLEIELSRAYPADHHVCKDAHSALYELDILRDSLNRTVYQEYPMRAGREAAYEPDTRDVINKALLKVMVEIGSERGEA